MLLKNHANRRSPDSGAARVLLIEDSDSDAGLVSARLAESNGTFAMERATSLAEGVARLESGAFDVVLLDLNLPDSAGLPTFEQLHEALPDLPVVVLTGLNDQQMATAAVAAGAQDFLAKEKADEDTLRRALLYAIERQRRRLAERHLRRQEKEFNAARAIQEKLLPNAAPDLPGFDIAGACMPAEATGGDYFDYFPMPDGRWAVSVGDVSSHGFAPALIMSGTRRTIRTLAKFYDKPDDILTEANCLVYEDTQGDKFVTLFLAQLDPGDGSVAYAGAGHEGYFFPASAEQPTRLQSTGYPLGVMPDARIERSVVHSLKSGDLLVLLTDGFQESCNDEGQLFGIQRTLDIVARARHQSAAQIVETLFAEILSFCQPTFPQDDVTAVVVKRIG